MGRYEVSAESDIPADLRAVFRLATDPDKIVQYETGIEQIEVVSPASERSITAVVRLRIGPVRLQRRYRYAYHPPAHYSGFQLDPGLVRGYFAFSFQSTGRATRVRHVEGIRSSVPALAQIVGWVYFKLLNRRSLTAELDNLAELVRKEQASASGSGDEV